MIEDNSETWDRLIPRGSPYFLVLCSDEYFKFEDFIGLCGTSLAYLPPNSKLLFSGAGSPKVWQWIEKNPRTGPFASRVELSGEVPENSRRRLLREARAAIVPGSSAESDVSWLVRNLSPNKPIFVETVRWAGEFYRAGIDPHLIDDVVAFRLSLSKLAQEQRHPSA